MNIVKPFGELSIQDIGMVGGKNASLGEMYSRLKQQGVRVPDGFATTAEAFWLFLDSNKLRPVIDSLMNTLDRKEFSNLTIVGKAIRQRILESKMPDEIWTAVVDAYHKLVVAKSTSVAVRSSATAEDLPNASFAGQHESFLNIKTEAGLGKALINCYASLFTDRAIKYREDNGFIYSKIALSVGVQQMVNADKACSGVCFTLEPESGFRDVIHIAGVWGLGENIVQGTVIPDEFLVFKPTLSLGKNAIIQKNLGAKEQTMVYAGEHEQADVINLITGQSKREQYVLCDNEITRIAQWALAIEKHYGKPMDIEWAKDGVDGNIYIIQARPETVHSQKSGRNISEYKLKTRGRSITSGQAIGSKVATGIARVLQSPDDFHRLNNGDIVVTDLTSPDWDPVLKKSAAIVTNKGGRTSHASIVARELGVPAVVGTQDATDTIIDGQLITVSCCEGNIGYVYDGKLHYEVNEIDYSKLLMPERTLPMLIAGDPRTAFQLSFYPNSGIGLMRMEFIITHFVKTHPLALLRFDELKNLSQKEEIAALTSLYAKKRDYFVDKLSQGIATLAAAFFPKPVIVRLSDFKSNEYANLLGGMQFEPDEENPMIGFRGASRYYHKNYKEAFRLECEAIRHVRSQMGLNNVKVLIPFCRTVEEGKRVLATMKEFGLDRCSDKGLEIYLMVEIPSNVFEINELAELFDGFSIGSNDLTQLTLGIDRDSALVADLFSEQNLSVKTLIGMAIASAKNHGKPIGLCGQAPSDFPEFSAFLVKKGIDSISFTSDALLRGIENIVRAENAILV